MKAFARITGLLILLIVFGNVAAAAFETIDVSNVLDTRRVVGVIYFPKNHARLTREKYAEIDQLVISALKSCGEHGIIRIEGFSGTGRSRTGELNIALKRARSVWNYVRINHLIHENLYLSGFNSQQQISELHGSRVEIATYANPFISIQDGITFSEGK